MKFSLRDQIKRQETLEKELTRLVAQAASAGEERANEESLLEIGQELKSDFDRLTRGIQTLLDQTQNNIGSSDAARSAQLMRLREQSSQTRRDWDRRWNGFETALRRSQLLGKPSTTKERNAPAADLLLNERTSLVQSMGMIDATIENAAAADAMIREQNATLISFTGKLGAIATKIPFLKKLLGSIHSRRTQEQIVLSLVIGVCMSIFIWMRILR